MKIQRPLLLIVLLNISVSVNAQESGNQVFEERILPIFKSENSSSCTKCHLSGVDLKNYLFPDHRKSFINLRDLGLVDLEKPKESKILKLISMTENEEGYGGRISDKMQKAEFDAFSAWIEASVADDSLRKAPPLEAADRAQPAVSAAVIRHTRTDRVLDSFTRNVWALRFRCAGCHMPGGPKYEKHQKKHGDKMAWLKADGPVASMKYLVESDLINLDKPAESELLLKPLDISDHEGGVKMRINDADYNSILAWITDYKKSVEGIYTDENSLPERFPYTGTEIWIRLMKLPENAVGKIGYITVTRWNAHQKKWNPEPWAVTSGTVVDHPRFGIFIQGFLMAKTGPTSKEQQLRPTNYSKKALGGRFRIELKFASDDGPKADWTEAIRAAELAGAIERGVDGWRPGFKNAVVVPNFPLGESG